MVEYDKIWMIYKDYNDVWMTYSSRSGVAGAGASAMREKLFNDASRAHRWFSSQ
jgi:uncharacterized membrane protein